MENDVLESDIRIVCIPADTFPDGVMAAHQKLHGLLPGEGRTFYGISCPDRQGNIVYKAAATEITEGEAEKLGCESFVLKKGNYISIFISDYCNDIPAIGKAFQQLIADPRIDPEGVCVEVYVNDEDVRCMVRILEEGENA